jgi:putative ABC transport system permease protein
VIAVALAAVRRRRLQSLVIGTVVLLTGATTVLAIGLLVASSAPFDSAFARLRGAHATASFAPSTTTTGLAATATRPGVAAAAGPFEAVSTAVVGDGNARLPVGLVVGRADAGGSVDRLHVDEGAWLTGPGEIVLSRGFVRSGSQVWKVGGTVTVNGTSLRVVGFAESVTGTAGAWVWPGQLGSPTALQMLYRFASAGTDDDVRAGLAAATADLPAGALTGSSSYLAVKLRANEALKPMVPFVVAFAVLGLVMSTLIVVNVVAGAVVAGYRAIGVQKALGFSPAQVVAGYAVQVLVVGVPACVVGVVAGSALAVPVLAMTSDAYSVAGAGSVPLWVPGLVLLAVPAVVLAAAVAPALRAGRLSAVQAITVGRAPRAGRAVRLRRALALSRLPRPVALGLGAPFARPARAAVTVVAVLLGAATFVLAAGLATTLTRVAEGVNRTGAAQVLVPMMAPPDGDPGGLGPARGAAPQPADPAAVRAAIAAQPGTAHIAGLSEATVDLVGSTQRIEVRAYDGEASWTGYPIIAGRWYANADEVVASSRMLRLTGARVGDAVTISGPAGQRRVRVVGEVMLNGGDPTLVMDAATLSDAVGPVRPRQYEVALQPGTDPHTYADRLAAAVRDLSADATVSADTQENEAIAVMLALIGILALLLGSVAALGVFNTVVLNTRERVHEIGVLKSVGMTPRQVRGMVVTSMVAVGLVGGALAVPVGWGVHRWIVPVMFDAAGFGYAPEFISVYEPWHLVALAASGVLLAVLGALVPAGWAARTRPAVALRAE